MDSTSRLDRGAIDRVIRKNLKLLKKPGVLTVRPGYQITDGRITGRPAIVATVVRKRARVPPSQRLPSEVDGIAVDVRPSTAMQRLRAKKPAAHALLAQHGPPEYREPEWPYERRVSDGRLLSSLPKQEDPASREASQKPELPYTPAAPPLKKVTRPVTILACASPDAGFTVLAEFLRAAKSSLTVGLYDFTSAEILQTLTGILSDGRVRFKMVLDHPSLNPNANQSDEQTVTALQRADRSAAIVWALTQLDPDTTKWIFPTAYHIKVAVRDSSAMWLSSGNWNISNQPNLAARRASSGSLATADRDWHVVIMDEGLARLYETYIEHDFTVASGAQANAATRRKSLHAAIEGALKLHRAEQRKLSLPPAKPRGVPFTLGKPKLFPKARGGVQPLLTPDKNGNQGMYAENVLALISSAKQRLYIQTQYVHPTSDAADRQFTQLIEAVAAAVRRKVEVRLIASQYENTPQYVELMHEYGLSGVLRVQENVHNKGIVVDSKVVMVSSQNWSSQGVLQNRDAGVIISNPAIAQYFEANFVQDWTDRADVKLKWT